MDLNPELVTTASFYSIQKLSPITSEKLPVEEDISVTPRQTSRSTNASGEMSPNKKPGKQNDRNAGYAQRRQLNKEDDIRVNNNGDNGLPKSKQRRLFPITRTTNWKYPVVETDHDDDRASSESTTLDKKSWLATTAGLENSLRKSCEWVEKFGLPGKESRSTSGHTVHIHSRRTSSSRSSAPPESIPSRTTEQLTNKSGLADQAVSHRHCEACKVGEQRLSSSSPSGSQTAVEKDCDTILDSGNKSHRSTPQTCCRPHVQNAVLGKGEKMQLEKQNGSVTKIQDPVRDDKDGQINTFEDLAPNKIKSTESRKTEEISRSRAFLGVNESISTCVSTSASRNKALRRSDHEHHTKPSSSSDALNSFLGPVEPERGKSIGRLYTKKSSLAHTLRDKNNQEANLLAPISPSNRVQKIQTSNSSLSTDISPKIRTRTERASSADAAVHHASTGSNPIPINKDGKLVLYFADDTTPGIYLVEIEASISLSAPDPGGWRYFLIPGLPLQGIDIPVLVNFRVQSIPLLDPARSGKSSSIENPDCSWIAEAQFNSNHLFDVGLSTPTQISGKLWLKSASILQLRLKIPVYKLDCWDTSTSLRTFPQWFEGHGLQIEHHASLDMIGLAHDIFAERVKYSFIIKNLFCNAAEAEYTIAPGECLIELGKIDWQDQSMQHHGELTVIRHLEDLCKPLEISFTLTYPQKDQLTIRLPTLSPTTGDVKSERVVMVKALSPLVFEYPESDSVSTWRRIEHSEEQPQADCFDRQHLPRLFPEGLKDGLVMRVNVLAPVCFRALQCEGNPLISEDPSNLVWSLDINIDKVFGGGLQCLMKFNVQAGSNDQILTVSPHDWTPDLFVIERRLATPAVGEWRKDRHGNVALFRLPEIAVGQTIEIALRWYKMIVRGRLGSDDQEPSAVQHWLPKIIGKSILGGSLHCNVDSGLEQLMLFNLQRELLTSFSAIHISSNGKLRDAPWQSSNSSFEKPIRLPKLYLGYSIGLSIADVPNQPGRSIRFKDEESKSACTDSIKRENHESRLNNQAATEQHTPVHTLHPDRRSSSTLNPRTREKAVSWARYSCKLILRLLRCAFTPFLLICAFQFGLSRIMHARRPVDIMGFSSVKARHDSLWSILNLGSLAVPWSQSESEEQSGPSTAAFETEEAFSGSTTEHLLGLKKIDGAENEMTIESSEDPEHEEPTADGIGVMDWIDRALGWKDITQ